MKTKVTVTRNKRDWLPVVGELVHYKSPKSGSVHKLAMRVDTLKADNGKLRFAFIDNGKLGDTIVGSDKAISKAISAGRIKPYTGEVTIAQSA